MRCKQTSITYAYPDLPYQPFREDQEAHAHLAVLLVHDAPLYPLLHLHHCYREFQEYQVCLK